MLGSSNIMLFFKRHSLGGGARGRQGLPWWLGGKESACPCRRRGFHLWSGKIPLVSEQPSPWITTTQAVPHSLGATTAEPHPQLLKRALPGARALQRSPHTAAGEGPPLATTREIAHTATQTQHGPK